MCFGIYLIIQHYSGTPTTCGLLNNVEFRTTIIGLAVKTKREAFLLFSLSCPSSIFMNGTKYSKTLSQKCG